MKTSNHIAYDLISHFPSRKRSFLVKTGDIEVTEALLNPDIDTEQINQLLKKNKIISMASTSTDMIKKLNIDDASLKPEKLSTIRKKRKKFSHTQTYLPFVYKG